MIRISPNKVFIVSPQDSGTALTTQCSRNLIRCGRYQYELARLVDARSKPQTPVAPSRDSGKSLSQPQTLAGLPCQIWSKLNTCAAHVFEIHTFRHGCDSTVRLHFPGKCRRQKRIVVVSTRSLSKPRLRVNAPSQLCGRYLNADVGTPDDTPNDGVPPSEDPRASVKA